MKKKCRQVVIGEIMDYDAKFLANECKLPNMVSNTELRLLKDLVRSVKLKAVTKTEGRIKFNEFSTTLKQEKLRKSVLLSIIGARKNGKRILFFSTSVLITCIVSNIERFLYQK